jgi:hypothetical protein
MVSYHHSYRTRLLAGLLIVTLLMPTSMLLVDAKREDVSTNPIIDPLLAAAIEDTSSGEKLPIVVYFPEGTTPESISSSIDGLELGGIEVRHVFHLIPAASLYATATEIEALSNLYPVQGIALDVERSVLAEEILEYHSLSSQDLEYEHCCA